MDEKSVSALVGNTALLMEQFERRCSIIEHRLDQTSQSLDSLASHVPSAIEQSADRILGEIPPRVMDRVREGIDRELNECELRLNRASNVAIDASAQIAGQMAGMAKLHRHLAWKVVGVVGGAIVMLLVATTGLSLHYLEVIRHNQLSADLLKAYNHADVMLCGGQLCANVDAAGAKKGHKGQYLPVKPRSG